MKDWLACQWIFVVHILQNLLFEYEPILVCIQDIENEPHEAFLVVEVKHHDAVDPLFKE